jgi:anti-sigma28 factor (negative regulator of flagellin synthesis)
MQINGSRKIGPYAIELDRTKAAEQEKKAPATPAAAESAPVRPKQDTVSFSEAGRALAGGAAAEKPALTAERVEEVRQRILAGAYNTAEMAGEVAKRIMQRGDI